MSVVKDIEIHVHRKPSGIQHERRQKRGREESKREEKVTKMKSK
jgi:hypothetical protein